MPVEAIIGVGSFGLFFVLWVVVPSLVMARVRERGEKVVLPTTRPRASSGPASGETEAEGATS